MGTSVARVIVMLLLVLVIFPLLPILITGRWDWWEVWVYVGIHLVGFVGSRALASRRHPDLLEERARSMEHQDTAPFDKVLAPLVALGGGILLPLAAGLEARLVPGTDFGAVWNGIGIAVMVIGHAFGAWALVENRFFSGTVRLQEERGHVVVDTGPYRYVRHPGYVGGLIAWLGAPVLLDSWWAMVAFAFVATVLILRTALEDRWLREHLDGYGDYAERTRFRLIPGLW